MWILFYFHQIAYPVIQHPTTMMGGFLLCFVCGFLMTAAPKFTGSHPMTSFEFSWSLILIALLAIFSVFFIPKYFYLLSGVIFISLIIYFLRRFLNRSQNPPPPFVFIGLGLSMGLVGSLGLFFSENFQIPEEWFRLFRLFYLQGYVLSLVVGVGSRLVVALLGHAPMPTEVMKMRAGHIKIFLALMILFLLSYIIEVFYEPILGQVIKNSLVTFICLRFWKIHRKPASGTRHAWGLLISAWLMLFGLWGSLWTDYRIHFAHIFYIGGLGLITLLIAVRVVLSHGQHGLRLESQTWFIPIFSGLVIAAAITRLSAGFVPQIYLNHLAYAATVWCVGLILWGVVLLPKIIRTKTLPPKN